MRTVVAAILDRCDRRGALPKAMVLHCRSREEHEAAERLLAVVAVRPIGGGRSAVRLDLARADARLRAEGWPGLSEVLYEVTRRIPRNLRAETVELRERAAGLARALADHRAGAAGAFLRAQAQRLAAGSGELFELAAGPAGSERLEKELEITARSIELAEQNRQPVRLANFSRRATDSTKGLRAGDRRYSRVADALLEHLPGLGDRVAAEGPRDPSERRRLALECLGIFRNETPIDVLCHGHCILEKRGRRLDAPAVHHELGEPCKLLLEHLRDARVVELHADRVVSIENETTFNDYVEWVRSHGRNEIVLLSEGQANWAVVRLLRMLATAAPALPLVHWGDMDRFGVLILRSLRHRTVLPIMPEWMDVETFERFAAAGLPLPECEREEIESVLSASPDALGGDLLGAIRDAGRWIEQETVAEEVLGLRTTRWAPLRDTP